jgi:hypothetical protein
LPSLYRGTVRYRGTFSLTGGVDRFTMGGVDVESCSEWPR